MVPQAQTLAEGSASRRGDEGERPTGAWPGRTVAFWAIRCYEEVDRVRERCERIANVVTCSTARNP